MSAKLHLILKFGLTSLIVIAGSSVALRAQFDRVVLIEEFTSVTCDPCVAATQVMNDVLAANEGNAIAVRYHVNFPLPGDPWYQAANSDVDTRTNLYDVLGVPHARVDGLSRRPTNKSEMLTSVANQRQQSSPIQIDVSQSSTDVNKVGVNVDVTAGGDGLGGGYRLYVAVVEDYIEEEEDVKNLPGYNGETEFFDVFRAFVNGSSGDVITLNPNQTKNLSFTYDVQSDWVKEELYVVAFVQDEFTNDVVQTGFTGKLGSDAPYEHASPSEIELTVAPNPAQDWISVESSKIRAGARPVSLQVHDALGNVVKRVREEVEDQSIRLNVAGLPSGVYYLTMDSQDGVVVKSFVHVR
jgi:hypothetical protein